MSLRRACQIWLICFCLAAVLFLSACGGGAGTSASPTTSNGSGPGGGTVTPPPPLTVTISPAPEIWINSDDNVQFTAKVTGTANQSVSWQANAGNLPAGKISLSGLFSGDGIGGNDVWAISNATSPPTTSPKTRIHVVLMAMYPPTAVLLQGQSRYLGNSAWNNADPSLLREPDFVWSVVESGGGSVDGPLQRYTAPSTNGTFHVKAAIAADTTKFALATITVTDHGFKVSGNLPDSVAFHYATLLPNGQVSFVALGPSANAYLYDPLTRAFTPAGTTDSSHLNSPILLKDGRLFFCSNSSIVPSQFYDPASGIFTATGTPIIGRSNNPVVIELTNGKVLVAGGDYDPSIDAAELFDPTTGKFTLAPPMAAPFRGGGRGVVLSNGTVLLVSDVNPAQIYDSATSTFTPVFADTRLEQGFFMKAQPNGDALLVGRESVSIAPTNPARILRYRASTGRIVLEATVDIPITNPAITSLSDGRLFLVGGTMYYYPRPPFGSGLTVFNSPRAFILDLSSATVTETGQMNFARNGQTATALPDGTVLVTGGFGFDVTKAPNDGSALYSMEIWK